MAEAMAEEFEEKVSTLKEIVSSGLSDVDLEKGALSCDDEGYETPGKKDLSVKLKQPKDAGNKKSIDNASEDDGYETGGKKAILLKPKSTGVKEGRKLRSGGSPRADPHLCSSDKQIQSNNSSSTGSSSHEPSDDMILERIIKDLEGLVDRESLTDSALQLLRLVPDGYVPLPHQVGGHRHIDGKPGFLRRIGQPHLLYKPVQFGSKGVREVSFYDAVYGRKTHLGDPSIFPSLFKKNVTSTNYLLKSGLPMYHGLTTIADRAGHNCDYLILEDITHRFTHPCILDLKMGQRVWDDHAHPKKIERELKKYPAQETFGFRISGMRVYKPLTDDYAYYDRYFGRSVTEATAVAAIEKFFEVGDGTHRTDIINGIISKLTELTQWMEKQNSLSMFATSLLIVYEGGTLPVDGCGRLDMRLVDFAHTYEKESTDTPDANALYGVRNYIRHLQMVLDNIISSAQ